MLVAKSSSELDFSLAYSYLYGFAMKILALAVINIEVNFIFLTRLFVSLWYEAAHRAIYIPAVHEPRPPRRQAECQPQRLLRLCGGLHRAVLYGPHHLPRGRALPPKTGNGLNFTRFCLIIWKILSNPPMHG